VSDLGLEQRALLLRRLAAGLGKRNAMTLTPHDLVAYCQMRKEKGAGPYTCNMEVSKLAPRCARRRVA
jgi:hypothetical protein